MHRAIAWYAVPSAASDERGTNEVREVPKRCLGLPKRYEMKCFGKDMLELYITMR